MKASTKTWISVGAATALAAVAAALLTDRRPIGNTSVPEPAKSVDLRRYLGVWFEIARYDQRFERSCAGDITATYSLRSDGSVNVINRCRRADGSIKEARGRAKIVDTVTNAKLKVSFFGPFYGDYWVLDRDDDYRWAIIGEPSGRYLWILARDADLGPEAVKQLVDRAKKLGYDTRNLIYPQQS